MLLLLPFARVITRTTDVEMSPLMDARLELSAQILVDSESVTTAQLDAQSVLMLRPALEAASKDITITLAPRLALLLC
jgi:hypothetical protein